MAKYEFSKEGYIVFEDGGTSPISYGACEEWFPTYDAAIEYALSVVKENTENLKRFLDTNSVIVYEGSKEYMKSSHSCPGGHRVVFYWNNYALK